VCGADFTSGSRGDKGWMGKTGKNRRGRQEKGPYIDSKCIIYTLLFVYISDIVFAVLSFNCCPLVV
jgi:hypothetical protein